MFERTKCKFLHIANNANFIPSAIEQFEKATPKKSIYLINGGETESRKFLKYNNENIIVSPYESTQYRNYINNIGDNVIVIFHNLSTKHKEILPLLAKRHTIVWVAWGTDLYQSKKLKHLICLSKTRRLKNKLTIWNRGCFIGIIKFIRNYLRKDNGIDRYLKYVDYIAPVIKEDYDLLTENNKKVNLKYIPFNYSASINNKENAEFFYGENILIGNSANLPNNHIETFELLEKLNITNRKIIVPLNYGGFCKYKEHILKLGENLFKNLFYPLENFIPLQEYNNLLKSVGYAFMNSTRQHAMGSTIYLLYNGVKVYMNEKSTAFKHLIDIGVGVYSIDSILSNQLDVFEPLPIDIKRRNREVINYHYNDKVLLEQTKHFVEYFELNYFN